jgi:hypothetical protein
MTKLFVVLALLVSLIFVSGCKSSGSREFIPGKGWKTND